MTRTTQISLLSLLGVLAAPALASAHLMSPGHATVHQVGASVFSVVWLSASTLRGVDDDRDGLLSQVELERHQGALTQELASRWRLRSGDEAATVLRVDLILQPSDAAPPPADRADQLVMLHHAQFTRTPQQIALDTDLFPSSAAPQLVVDASREQKGESVILRPGSAHHVFFSAPPSWQRRAPVALLLVLLGGGLAWQWRRRAAANSSLAREQGYSAVRPVHSNDMEDSWNAI